jgi:hypothetical protein
MVERTRRRIDDDDTPTDSGPRGIPVSVALVWGMAAVFLALVVGAVGGYVAGRTTGAAAALEARTELSVARVEAEAQRAAAEKARANAEAGRKQAEAAVKEFHDAAKVADAKAEPKKPKVKPIPREEFRTKVLGKSMKEVIDAVGKPDKTQDYGDMVYWYYTDRTQDPVTEKVDLRVQVFFENGTAKAVSFSN